MQLIKIQHRMKYLIAVWSLYPIGLPGIFQFVSKWFASLHQNSSIDQTVRIKAECSISSPSTKQCVLYNGCDFTLFFICSSPF